ncbi:MAG: Fis family transcriptional regulator [Candidatus Poribacteria bacterium]|nr:MAG: Fis family transcriptional regulator [Candidatus Poribacteria bacterium]
MKRRRSSSSRTAVSQISTREWKALLEISERINSSLELNAVLHQSLEMLAELVRADASSIWLLDENRQELYCAAATGEKGAEIVGFRMPWDQGIVGWTVQHDRVYVTNEASQDEHHASEIAETVGYECHTLLCVPMHSRGRVIGAIEVINKWVDEPFTDYDSVQLSLFANLVGLAIENAHVFTQVQEENRYLREELGHQRVTLERVVARSPKMQQVLRIVERVAASDSTVLIRGESGTGKEVIAQLIHSLSPRSQGPFIAINCASIPESLLESELFGHERGAFTGATARRIGRFELAKGGTLFLDEIGDMPLPLQAKLLRVLQERRFERLGGNEPIEADVRILAATHQDLEQLIQEGRFREDLYYRLNVIAIELPPLRERPEDVLPLAEHFLEESRRRLGRGPRALHPETQRLLLAHRWPGNIRELQNAIEHAVVLSTTPEVLPSDLPIAFQKLASESAVDVAGVNSKSEEIPDSLEEAQRIFRREHVRRILQRHGGNRTEAAKALGIQRTYLSRLIRELGITDL